MLEFLDPDPQIRLLKAYYVGALIVLWVGIAFVFLFR
jgi:hypothetical protein